MRYFAEVIREEGHSYAEGRDYDRDRVLAYAFDVGIEFLPDAGWNPRLSLEYMFGSGDANRRSVDQSFEEEVLFPLLHPFPSELVDHLIVNLDELIELVLTGLNERRAEILVLYRLNSRCDEV